jgi:hypothetical protein
MRTMFNDDVFDFADPSFSSLETGDREALRVMPAELGEIRVTKFGRERHRDVPIQNTARSRPSVIGARKDEPPTNVGL